MFNSSAFKIVNSSIKWPFLEELKEGFVLLPLWQKKGNGGRKKAQEREKTRITRNGYSIYEGS